jgi:hypothetical protein
MDPIVEMIAGYLACHILAYIVVFRKMAPFRTEKGIFSLHAVSYLIFAAALALMVYRDGQRRDLAAPYLALGLSLHGIYSLSFLELWSLTQGSYSLTILSLIASNPGRATLDTILPLCAIGSEKEKARTSILESLGLIRPISGAQTVLTFKGSLSARLVRLVYWFTDGRSLNR